MAFDAHANFGYGVILNPPSPAASGTSLTLASGQGALMPTPPFNGVVWPAGSQPTATNAEIVRVTGRATDTLTIVRGPQATDPGGVSRTIGVGDQFAAAITAKMLTDVEALTQAATTLALGVVQVQPSPNVAATPVALGFNGPPVNLSQNGPWPLPPSQAPNADAAMFSQLTSGLAASATVQGSPRDCSNTDFLYVYRALFTGSALATLVVQSSPDMVTWTQEGSVAATQLGATGRWAARFETTADQTYFQCVLTNSASVQSASATLIDGTTLLAVA